jgi:hypothetical protein
MDFYGYAGAINALEAENRGLRAQMEAQEIDAEIRIRFLSARVETGVAQLADAKNQIEWLKASQNRWRDEAIAHAKELEELRRPSKELMAGKEKTLKPVIKFAPTLL